MPPFSREQFELRKKGLKRCQGPCGQILPITAFQVVYRTLKSGEKRAYPRYRCPECDRKAQRKIRDKRRKEGTDVEINRRHHAAIMADPERHEAYKARQREWSRMNDILTGRVTNPTGPWKKYRKPEPQTLVDPDLFLEWLQLQPHPPELTDSEARRIRQCRLVREPPPSDRSARAVLAWIARIEMRLQNGGGLLSLGIIDRVMTRANEAIKVGQFYPPGEH